MRTIFLLFVISVAVGVIVWAANPLKELSTASLNSSLRPALTSEPGLNTDIPQLRQLEQAYQPASAYWRFDPVAEAHRIEKILTAARQARAALTAAFGPSVRENPAHWRLFRPLNDRMPGLSSEQQIKLFELEQRLLVSATANNSSPQFRAHLANVHGQLGPEVTQEYALRASPVAEELRRVGAALTEADFRQAFATLNRLSEETNQQQYLSARRDLRQRLGNRAFAKLWSARDPNYSDVRQVAGQFDLDEDTALTAYALLLENQDAMLAAIAGSGEDTHSDAVRSQYESGRRRLQELVGERTADALLQAAAGLLR